MQFEPNNLVSLKNSFKSDNFDHVGYEGNRLERSGWNVWTSIMQILITKTGLNKSETKCLCLSKLIVFQPIKNEILFLPLMEIYEERFTEKYSK